MKVTYTWGPIQIAVNQGEATESKDRNTQFKILKSATKLQVHDVGHKCRKLLVFSPVLKFPFIPYKNITFLL